MRSRSAGRAVALFAPSSRGILPGHGSTLGSSCFAAFPPFVFPPPAKGHLLLVRGKEVAAHLSAQPAKPGRPARASPTPKPRLFPGESPAGTLLSPEEFLPGLLRAPASATVTCITLPGDAGCPQDRLLQGWGFSREGRNVSSSSGHSSPGHSSCGVMDWENRAPAMIPQQDVLTLGLFIHELRPASPSPGMEGSRVQRCSEEGYFCTASYWHPKPRLKFPPADGNTRRERTGDTPHTPSPGSLVPAAVLGACPGVPVRAAARVGALGRVWVGLQPRVRFWCKQTHKLVSLPPCAAPRGGCTRTSPLPTSTTWCEPAGPWGNLGAVKALGCLTWVPGSFPRSVGTRVRSPRPSRALQAAALVTGTSWALSPASCHPFAPFIAIAITSSRSPHLRESILPSQPLRARTQGLVLEGWRWVGRVPAPWPPTSLGVPRSRWGSCLQSFPTQQRSLEPPWASGAAGITPHPSWAGFWSHMPL